MDTVEDIKSGKVLLTIHFTNCQFMLAFLRDANTSKSVTDIFESLYSKLTLDIFKRLFPVILTDNGNEFTNPTAIELDKQRNRRTYIFYCDPFSSYQKDAAKNNHELIRRIVLKGSSFNPYKHENIILMMNHTNSYGRKKLNYRSPRSVFSFLHGIDVLRNLDTELIPPNDIILNPKLLSQ